MDIDDSFEMTKLAAFVLLVLAGLFGFLCVIELPLFLPKQNCLMYRYYTAGANEMNYCTLGPEDDDLILAFDHKEDNIVRYDSTSYLIPVPFSLYRVTKKFNGTFEDKDYKRYHYTFSGDYITGTAKCNDDCVVQVISGFNTCDHYLPSSFYNRSAEQFLIGKTGRRNCGPRSIKLLEKEGTGTIKFTAEMTRESLTYVRVLKRGAFKHPTGKIEYVVAYSLINTTNATKTCNSYGCEFANLTNVTGNGRNTSMIAVNIFHENMTGEYIMNGYYRPTKWTNIWICVGFGGVVVLALFGAGLCGIILLLLFLIDEYCIPVKDLQTTTQTNQNTPQAEMKEVQTPTAGGDPETQTTPGACDEVKPTDDNPDPVPDYYSSGTGEIPMQSV